MQGIVLAIFNIDISIARGLMPVSHGTLETVKNILKRFGYTIIKTDRFTTFVIKL